MGNQQIRACAKDVYSVKKIVYIILIGAVQKVYALIPDSLHICHT